MSFQPPELEFLDPTHVCFRGRACVYFGGCDYYRLASHPSLHRAARSALRRFGLNVAASRRTTGNHPLYGRLERRLAEYFSSEEAVVLSSGYAANLAAAQALNGRFSHVFIDERAHASLWDAATHLSGSLQSFRHRDPADLRRKTRRLRRDATLVVLTDGLFSHDGSVAPLGAYFEVLPASAWILVDDAHGAGVVGATGRGTPEAENVARRRLIQTVTLSKAFGSYGGAVVGSRALCQRIRSGSRLFIGNTPPPLPLVAAAEKAVEILDRDGSLRERLECNARFVKNALIRAGWTGVDTPGPIVGLRPDQPRQISRLRRRLLDQDVFPSFIRYPGGPDGGYFRFAISSEHQRGHLERLIGALTLPPTRRAGR